MELVWNAHPLHTCRRCAQPGEIPQDLHVSCDTHGAVDCGVDEGACADNPLQSVASLAEPTLQPRQNRAAMLRAGQVPGDAFSPSISRAEIAARNKAREAAERAEKRRSVQLPASLVSPPELAPRPNRASQLRLGQAPTASPYRDPKEVAEQAVRNKARDAAERAEKIKSVQLPTSLTSNPVIVSCVVAAAHGQDADDMRRLLAPTVLRCYAQAQAMRPLLLSLADLI